MWRSDHLKYCYLVRLSSISIIDPVSLWCDGEPLAPKVPVSDRRNL